jgi:hypothetical protein
VQKLGIRFQRPAAQRLDRSWVGAVIKEVVEWSIHPTSIYGNGQLRLCRVLSVGTGENQSAGEFTWHSPELGIVAETVDGDAFAQSGALDGVAAGLLQGGRGEMRIDASREITTR